MLAKPRTFRSLAPLATLILLCAAASAAASVYTDEKAWAAATQNAASPEMAFVKADPALPNVLLIGDSISMGYTTTVRQALAGKANVYRVWGNGGDTARGLAQLDKWLVDMKWAAIHFNFGLHDLKYLDPKGKYDVKNGKQVASPEQYAQNLTELVKRLQATGAKLIYATTTPVPADSAGRIENDDVKYNAAAVKVMKEAGVAIDDLGASAKAHQSEWQLPKNVHFNPAGYQALGDQVAAEIGKAIGVTPNKTTLPETPKKAPAKKKTTPKTKKAKKAESSN